MSAPSLLTTIDEKGVARLTLNRPELRNAFDEQLIGEICETIGRCSADNNVRVIVLTGAGTAFSAGADLNMMKRVAEYSTSENRDDARRLAHMLQAIYSATKPTIALVNGPAMGGALGIIGACDIAIAADSAIFALTEVRVGLIPAVISPFVIQAIGVRQARRYFLSGEKFDAHAAHEMGLVHTLVSANALNDALDEMIDHLIKGAPGAQHEAKDLIRSVKFQPISNTVLSDTADRIASRRATGEGKEGITAFLEKRKPSWVKD